MKYLLLLHSTDDARPADPSSPEYVEMFSAYRAALDAMDAAGVLLECAPLEPASAARTVRVRGADTLVTDAPAAEAKEQVGGYALIECASVDEAVKWAATIPAARDSSVEVREVRNIAPPR